ncbi:hypothetical protein GCM10007216_09530 [Thalassobacillus devorans]|uniref:Uncharacterized protein n=1 Tax=Thalassobacillus devorans TaxID=279813 RepID=A0ABQ1NMX5_9BACI|nr:hypothetical protein GCM10007216_09530 [Thalassobacillus devorans]
MWDADSGMRGSVKLLDSWVAGNGETPVGEGSRRDPTGSETTEEARRLPHRKANRFPAALSSDSATDPTISRNQVFDFSALLLKRLLMINYQKRITEA